MQIINYDPENVHVIIVPKRIEKHHRLPKSKGGRGKDNLEPVDSLEHFCYHILFGNALPDEVAEILKTWLPKNVKFTITS